MRGVPTPFRANNPHRSGLSGRVAATSGLLPDTCERVCIAVGQGPTVTGSASSRRACRGDRDQRGLDDQSGHRLPDIVRQFVGPVAADGVLNGADHARRAERGPFTSTVPELHDGVQSPLRVGSRTVPPAATAVIATGSGWRSRPFASLRTLGPLERVSPTARPARRSARP